MCKYLKLKITLKVLFLILFIVVVETEIYFKLDNNGRIYELKIVRRGHGVLNYRNPIFGLWFPFCYLWILRFFHLQSKLSLCVDQILT